MEARAIARFIRISPRKTRLVADTIRGKNVREAKAILKVLNKRPARVLEKILGSAVANARQKELNEDILKVESIYVDQGPYLKRYMPAAMGRATMIRRPTSHITVIVAEDIRAKQKLEVLKQQRSEKKKKRKKREKS